MKKILLATLILSLALVEGVCASPKEDVKKGNLLYNDKKYDEAVRAYNEALSKRPDSGIANLNLGAALYKKGSYDRAIDSFNRTIASGGGRFVSIADYNIGNAQYKLGNLKEASDVKRAKELYEMALKFYKRSMELDPRDKDTKFNYEFVENRLKNLSQTQKKEEEKKDKNEEKKEDNKKDKSQDQDKSAGGGGGGQGEEKKKEEEKNAAQGNEDKSQEDKQQEAKQQEAKQGEGEEEKSDEEKQKEEMEKEAQNKALQVYEEPQGAQGSESQEMSEQEAKMLLEGYKGEEATGRTIKMRKKPIKMSEPVKDW